MLCIAHDVHSLAVVLPIQGRLEQHAELCTPVRRHIHSVREHLPHRLLCAHSTSVALDGYAHQRNYLCGQVVYDGKRFELARAQAGGNAKVERAHGHTHAPRYVLPLE